VRRNSALVFGRAVDVDVTSVFANFVMFDSGFDFDLSVDDGLLLMDFYAFGVGLRKVARFPCRAPPAGRARIDLAVPIARA